MSVQVKTAISLQQYLFDEVNALAAELNMSRSKFFVVAAEAFIEKMQHKKMLLQINAAYSQNDIAEDANLMQSMRNKQAQLVAKEAW